MPTLPSPSAGRRVATRLTAAQESLLRLVGEFANDGSGGWAEVELQFSFERGIPDTLVYVTVLRVGHVLRRKGLLVADGSSVLTEAGTAWLTEHQADLPSAHAPRGAL